eukprot:TRINITY_DN3347_c0_g1_i10.p1 TRINITY_DN3347_c0_g1~~TRINITY_DN3347_c0_g1_i10.p1  ORF type:complete len:308 (-),score=6.52 TRINITY_DN3347_c0_g1_i10:457-1380(-)
MDGHGTSSRQPLVKQESGTGSRQILCRQESGSSRGVPDPSASLDAIHPADRSSPRTSLIMNPLDPDYAPSGTATPSLGPASPSAQMSPPPSYHEIPGTVPAHQGVSRGPPPSYDEAVDPNAEPPSYDSLFGRIRDTHKASKNVIDFLVKVLLLLLGTIGCTIACSITIVIPVAMIVIGSVYFNDCPAEPYIPIFLIVGGAFSAFKYIIRVLTRVRRVETNSDQDPEPTHPAQSLITFFLCGWFITGCVWVYRIYWPKPHPLSEGDQDYCNRIVYVFSFWLITTAYIFLGLFTSCICCFSIVSLLLKR